MKCKRLNHNDYHMHCLLRRKETAFLHSVFHLILQSTV